MKRVLITGRGTSGSWKIRAEQLGAAIGANVIPDATIGAIRAHDVTVMVKRPSTGLIERLHTSGMPWIWDVVDAWPQPLGNDWAPQQAMGWMWSMLDSYMPSAVVAATDRMRVDIQGLNYKRPVLWLRHHARPGLQPVPLRENVKAIVYEGGERYLGRWAPLLEAECVRRGWKFLINPPSLHDGDIVVALRDHHGYPTRCWKSAVKLANAQAAGIPVICSREMGYLEVAGEGEMWCNNPENMAGLLDQLTPLAERQERRQKLLAKVQPLDEIARTYRAWLQTIT